MIPSNRIVFLYMVPATGHQKAAEAIMEAASHMDPRVACVGIEAANHAYPVLGNVFNRMYLQMIKRAPMIWDYLYDNPDIEEFTREARGFLTLLSSVRTRGILKKHHPQAVVCTQAVPAVAFAAEKRNGHLKSPLVCVVTDFAVHSYWYHQEVDLYLVAHEDVRQEMIHRGIHKDKVRVTGIPIMPSYGETATNVEARLRLRLNPHKKTVLVMGGSHGLGSLDELVDVLKKIPLSFQTIVICGRNRNLLKKVTKSIHGSPDFHVYGYMKDLSPLMKAADVLITKPGGLTCSEALATQLPMVLSNPLPGQEERNVRFLLKHQVAKLAQTPEDVSHNVSEFLRHPARLMRMRQRAKLISKPHAAWEAARYIFDLIHRRGKFAHV